MKRVSIVVVATLLTILFSIPARAGLRQSSGKVTMLRVHDVGSKYGPPNDQINVEVVIQLNTKRGQAFGFQLRNDSNRPAREGMLALLRDAFNNNWQVTIDYNIATGKKNGVIIRVWLTKPSGAFNVKMKMKK